MTPTTLTPEANTMLADAVASGRIRGFYEQGSHIVVVPLAGKPIHCAGVRAVESALRSLGSGHGNVSKPQAKRKQYPAPAVPLDDPMRNRRSDLTGLNKQAYREL